MATDDNLPQCLLISPTYRRVRTILEEAARQAGFLLTRAQHSDPSLATAPPGSIYSALMRADLIVADVSHLSVSTSYEFGLAHAVGKPALLLADEKKPPRLFAPGAPYLMYQNTPSGLAKLHGTFRRVLEDFKKSPGSFTASFLPHHPAPTPFIDLNKLEPREFENLCFELLTQIGFRRVEWGKEFHEVDVVATLKKKDPDGFEYQELWLISMGTRAPAEMLLEMASEPEFLYRRILQRRESKEINFGFDTPLTLLFIPFRFDEAGEVIEREVRRRLERGRREWPSLKFRTRIWNSDHLVNLIQQYPQLAQKYFSDEAGRSQSKYRKTPEELYSENVLLNERQQSLIAALEEEKDKRTRAERDAVWKDLSFTAAHKLGNPVFALETDLQALKKRIASASSSDAAQVAEEMSTSLEKAKAIIEQFKSLTKAQEISVRPVSIAPLIRAACRVAEQNGVEVLLQQPEHVPHVLADPGGITECFDELVANSLHWFDKGDKRLSIVLDLPKKKEIPELLDRAHSYVRIRFADNGSGVRAEHKKKIFDPFFTTHPHGTGLGLSLVERIIEGHGGCISENGKPGEGAAFEIYLPIAPRNGRKE